MIKLTLKQLASSISMGSIGRLISDANLPISVKLRIKNFWKQLKDHFETYEESRTELAKELGTLTPRRDNPEEKYYAFETPELEKQFNDRLKSLQATEIEILGDPLKPSDLKRKLDAPDPLTSLDLMELDFLIVEESEQADTPEAESDAE